MDKRDALPSHAAQALQAHNTAKQASQAGVPQRTEDITSLNKLLQWAAANSAEDKDAKPGATNTTSAAKAPLPVDQLRKEREWLDAAFPDVNEGLRQLVSQLDSEDASVRLDALSELQEFFLDLNHAVNIERLGALPPLMRLASPSNDNTEERALAVWCLGTAMQHVDSLKRLFVERRVHELIAAALTDSSTPPAVRAKAVMAASALLRNAGDKVTTAFDDAGGTAALCRAASDEHVPTRRRARFFLAHASPDFVARFVADGPAVAAFADSLADLSADDYADVEPAMGAVDAIVDADAHTVIQVAPELPGVIDALLARCEDEDIIAMIRRTAAKLP